jgi:hypothetical protein
MTGQFAPFAAACLWARERRRFILGAMASTWQSRLRALMGGKESLTALSVRAPMIVSAVLGLAVALQAVTIALSLSAEASAGSGTGTARPAHAQTGMQRGMRLANITAGHLFGVAPPTMTVANNRAASRTPLVLTGIIASPDPRDGYAILGSSATSTRTVYAGREAAPGIILAEVYPQWVVLLRGRERVTLRLPRNEVSAGFAFSSVLARGSPVGNTDDYGESGGDGTPAYLPPAPFTDGAAVLRSFALRPTKVDGQAGELIGGSSLSQKALAALDLSPGDVILQVNGVPVGARNSPDLMRVLQSGNATLMVVKDGQETSVTIDPTAMADAAAIVRQTQPDL